MPVSGSHGDRGNGSSGVTDLRNAALLSTTELMGLIAGRAALLAEKQVALAKAEARANVRAEIWMAAGFGIALVCAIVAVSLLLVAAVFAIEPALPAGAVALLLAGFMLLLGGIAALVGWRRRVTSPLAETRTTLKENLQWAKERLTGESS